MMRALAVAALLVALAAPAAGQMPGRPAESRISMSVQPIDGPIMPERGVGLAELDIVYAYFSGGVALDPTTIRLEVEGPAWTHASVTPSTIQVAPGPVPVGLVGRVHARAIVAVATDANAPAYWPGEIRIRATAEPNGLIAGSTAQEVLTVVADWFALTQVAGPRDVALEPGRDHKVAFVVANLGNAPARHAVTVVSAPEGVTVRVPEPFETGSRQYGNATHDAPAVVVFRLAPGSTGGPVVLRVATAYVRVPDVIGETVDFTIDVAPTKGDGLAIFFPATDGRVRTSSFGMEANGPGLAGALAIALAGAALAWRRAKAS
ncbi:MAG TPA: hypothetical protein VM889_06575 [Candidatus Thermoplasmatota archaeon]|nr:hypothetical protein [Candidatus Thermoplasmatota archaeon]